MKPKHGHASHDKSTPTYNSWRGMHRRCFDKNYEDFHSYGGRGITMCDRWRFSFSNFLSDMGVRPKGTTLDRRDNNKGYSRENCNWATRLEQNNNTRRIHLFEYNGMKKTLTNWAKFFNIKRSTLYMRIEQYGWEINRALHTTNMKGGNTVVFN